MFQEKNEQKWRRKSLIRQQDQTDCGIACLASIIKFHRGYSSLDTLRKLSGTSKQGTTLLGLLQAAKKIGLDGEGLQAESIDDLKEINEPAILHVVLENHLSHYLIYYRSEGEHYIVGDPAKGIVSYSRRELDTIWQSKALLKLTPTEGLIKNIDQRKKRKEWILKLIKPDMNLFVLSIFLGILVSALSISTAIFSQKLIDDILPKGDAQKLLLSLGLIFVLLLIRSALSYLRGFFMLRQSIDFNNRIIQSFYKNLLHLPKSFFDSRKTGDMIARMNDTSRIQEVLSSLLGNVVIDFLTLLVSFGFVFIYSSTIAFMVLVSLPVYFFILILFNKPIIKAQWEVMNGYALTESNFVDTISGISDIKLRNKQSFFEQVNAKIYGEFQKSIATIGRLNIKFGFISEVAGVSIMIVIFGIASNLVLSKDLKLGEMVALMSMTGSLIPSFTRLVLANIQIQEAMVAFDRMFEFTSIEKEYLNSELKKNELDNLNLSNVSFRFPGGRQILKNISLDLNKGKIVALLGESGGGKSTLIQLIQKFYCPDQGKIQVNGTDLSQLDTVAWRDDIGSVPQDLKIFNASLLFNITLSDRKDDYEKAIFFCEESGFGKYFNEFPQKYLTLLGEEGINISGGQKQLVILARALFCKPKLLLLDEATSAMDKDTEDFVISFLQRNKVEMTILIVTHRIRVAQHCDQVYILRDGLISESGSPKELMLSKNLFSNSFNELMHFSSHDI